MAATSATRLCGVSAKRSMHRLHVGPAVREPRGRERAEVGVVVGEQRLAPGMVLGLHQPAGLADQQAQRIPGLGRAQGRCGQVGVRGRRAAEVEEGQRQRGAAMTTLQTATPRIGRVDHRLPGVARRQACERQRPGDREARIEGVQPGIGRGDVGRRVAVEHLDIVGQRLQAVGAALRDQQRHAVVGREPLGVPLQEGRRAAAQIDRDVPDLAAQAADELRSRRAAAAGSAGRARCRAARSR